MEYTITADTDTERHATISIPATELGQFIDEEIHKVRKNLTLKGFRRGKVPTDLIKSRYQDTLKAQAMTSLVNDAYSRLLEEKQWRPASRAEIVKIDEDKDMIKVELHFEIIPEFTCENYLNIELFEPEPLPDQILLDRALNELREENASIKDVTRPAVVDDYVTADIVIKENDTVKTKQQNVRIRIGDRTWPDEINRALVGIKRTDKKAVQVDNTIYHITVEKIEEKIMPVVDDAFARSKEYENVEILKKKLLENALIIERRRIEGELQDSLSDILLERNTFPLPQAMVETEYRRILDQLHLTHSESQKERFWRIAEKRARFNLLIDHIANKENIHATEEEINSFASTIGIKTQNENQDNVIEYIKIMLTRKKTMDFLLEHAKVHKKSRIISPKEVDNDTNSVRYRTNQ